MAIKIKKTKERLKGLYPSLNLSHPKLNAIVVKISKQITVPEDCEDEEAFIDEALENFDTIIGFETVVKKAKHLAKLEKAAKSKEGKTGDDDTDDTDDDDLTDEEKEAKAAAAKAEKKGEKVPAWAKALIDSNKDLKKELQEIKDGKVKESKTSNARKLFDENETLKGLPDARKARLLKTLDLDDEDNPIEDQIAELAEEESTFVQSTADSTELAGPTPTITVDNNKATDAEVDAIVG